MLLSSCRPIKQRHVEYLDTQQSIIQDIPVPPDSYAKSEYSVGVDCFRELDDLSDNITMFGYISTDKLDSLERFYERELELYGWKIIDIWHGYESCIFASKPKKLVTISLRNNSIKKKREIVITVFKNKSVR